MYVYRYITKEKEVMNLREQGAYIGGTRGGKGRRNDINIF